LPQLDCRGLQQEPDLPLFEEMEELITGLGPDAAAAPLEVLHEQRAGFLRHLELIGGRSLAASARALLFS
jgi:hypothetical protein